MIVKVFNLIYKSITKSWNFLKYYLYNWIFKFRLWINLVNYGSNVRCKGSVPIIWCQYGKEHDVSIGNNCTFNSYADHSWFCKCKLMIKQNAKLTIGNNTGFNGVLIFCSDSITIGSNVKVGGGTRIFDTDHHPLNYLKRRDDNDEYTKKAPIVIGDDVFIGGNCIIGKGVSIGARSIIAAGSVVAKSIPADCIAGGNPCKVIKNLNTNIV